MSTPHIPSRPFYAEYAWTFDLLIERPVQQECRTIAACLGERGSVTELNASDRQLVLKERHTLNDHGHERSSDYRFVMQCWTRDELDSHLTRSGFVAPSYFGTYAVDVAAGTTDRLVAVAQLG
jgi:hypothetical protein